MRAISTGLREAIERSGDAPTGADRVHVFVSPLPADVDPLSLWEASSAEWAVSWETDDERWAGLGRTLSVPAGASATSVLDSMGSAVRTGAPGHADVPLRLFGALPFRPDEPGIDSDWGQLPECGFVLPRWSVCHRAGVCHLQLVLAHRLDAASLGPLLAELAVVEAALLEPPTPGADPDTVPSRSPRHHVVTTDGRAAWGDVIGEALTEIRGGGLEKVVVSRRLDLDFDMPSTGPTLLRRLRAERAGRFRFGLRHGETTFVGASPERLFEKRGERVQVEALAGTFDLGEDPDPAALVRAAEHLFASGKDLEEHALVVRGIVEALRPLASSVVTGDWPDVRAARGLAHLSTAIEADLRPGVSAFDLIEALHPTPAVGGLPREAALRFIRRFETVSRGLYAAPIGWIETGGDACLAVGIRSALLRPGRARVYAGAGIVAASDAEAEWQETGAKLRWLGELIEGES